MHRRSCPSLLAPASAASLLLVAIRVVAQAPAPMLQGSVYDPTHAAVANAALSLESKGVRQAAVTDASGHFAMPLPPPGTYTLTATSPGLRPTSSQVVVGAAALTLDLEFTSIDSATSVTVNANLAGSSNLGYYTPTVDPGVLGTTPIVDQPYTITTISTQQLTNTQVKNFRDAMKFLPLVSYTEQQGPEILRPATRGFQGSIAQNTRMDGRAMAITGANPLEQYQELQVVNGLGASFYGPANPSGVFDFVLKRPTENRTNNIYLEQDSSSVGTVWGDFGGRLGANKIFGYRSNLLFGDGTQFVEGSRLRRRLAMFAFDVRPTDRTTIEAHYSAYDIVQRGYPGWFSFGPSRSATATAQSPAPTYVLPAAPDPTRPGFGQVYAGVNLTTQSTGARLLHTLSPNWRLSAGFLGQRLDRFIDTPVNTITSNTGDYSSSLAAGFAPRFGVLSDLGYLTGTVNRWRLRQDIVIGSEGYRFSQYSYTSPSAASRLLGTANVAAPVRFDPPTDGLPVNRGLFQSAVVHQQGFNLGDLIYFPAHFAVRLAASQDWIGVDNNSATRRTSGSNKNGISPSASVLFKPAPWATAYGTFASSLQQGDIAPNAANLVNSGQSLAPYRSKEWEVGFKTDAHPIALTTALFRIQRPFAETVALNASQNVFRIVGQQVNYGAEISGQGTLFHRLLVHGGFTALNARLNNTGIPATEGKRFVGIPPYHSNLYAEYLVPGVRRLSLTGDWQFTGNRTQDDENLHTTPGFNTFDLGFRYARPIHDKLATLRFTTQNLGNVRYYSTIAAGDITGTNASANVAHLGSPRTLSTSLQFTF